MAQPPARPRPGLKLRVACSARRAQVYNVAGGKSLPEWLTDKKREALRKDEEFRRRIELIQARSRRPRHALCASAKRSFA